MWNNDAERKKKNRLIVLRSLASAQSLFSQSTGSERQNSHCYWYAGRGVRSVEGGWAGQHYPRKPNGLAYHPRLVACPLGRAVVIMVIASPAASANLSASLASVVNPFLFKVTPAVEVFHEGVGVLCEWMQRNEVEGEIWWVWIFLSLVISKPQVCDSVNGFPTFSKQQVHWLLHHKTLPTPQICPVLSDSNILPNTLPPSLPLSFWDKWI